MNIKLHGALYIAPAALYHVMGNWRRAPVIALVAALSAVAPFALPLFPPRDYLEWFAPMAGKENTSLGFARAAQFFAVTLGLPTLLWLLAGRPALRAAGFRLWAYLAAYVACVLLCLFPATKDGGGGHYFLPFLPAALDLSARALAAAGAPRRQRMVLVGTLALVTAGLYQVERRFLKKLEWRMAAEVVAEINGILDDYADKRVQMGVGRLPSELGDQYSYHYYAWRNLPVYRNHPYTIDSGIMMELTKLRVPMPAEALRRLETCHTQIWLIPKGGNPFELWGYYHGAVFSREFQDTFKAHYIRVESRKHFDIWACNGPSN